MNPDLFDGASRALFDALPSQALVMDVDFRIRAYNAAAEALIGAGRKPVLRLSGGEALHCIHADEDADGCGGGERCRDCSLRSAVATSFAEGIVIRRHARLERVHGVRTELLQTIITTSPLLLGEEKMVLLQFEDIGTLNLVEEGFNELKESEARYRELFEAESDAIFLIDNETGRILEANSAASALYGYDRSELLTLKNEDLSAEPTETKRVTRESPVREEGIVSIPSRRHRKKDGTEIVVEMTGRFFERMGRPVHIVAIRDVTEQRRMEEELRRIMRVQQIILDCAPVAISLMIDRKQVWVNRKNVELSQYSKEELEGQSTRHLYPSQEAFEQLGREVYPALARGEDVETVQELIRRDGSHFWARYHGRAVAPPDMSKGTIWILEDITERLTAERALRESELKFKTLFNTIQDAIFLTSASDGQIIECNEQLGGYSRDELIGNSTMALNLWANPHERQQVIDRVKTDGRVHDFEAIFRRKDGTVFPGSISTTPISINQGTFLLSVVRDITYRKRAEEELQESKQFLEAHIANSPLAIVEFDPAFRIIRWSGKAEQFFGWAENEVLGKTISELRWVYADDVESVRQLTEEMLAGGCPRSLSENRNYRKDGSVIWCEWYNSSIYDNQGKFKSLLSIVLDITSRKTIAEALRESEERYRAIVDSFDGQLYICSSDYRILFMNQKLVERTGRNAVGELCHKVLHDREELCPWCINERVFAGETVRWEVQSPKDSRWYYVVNTPIFNPDGTISKQAMIQDITERKSAEEEIRRLNARLEHLVAERTKELLQTNRDLSSFCYAISHELRAPVARLKGFSQMLQEDLASDPAEALYCAERIAVASSQLQRVIDSVLQLSRLSQATFSPCLLDISSLAREISAEQVSDAPGRRVEVIIADGLTATGDPQLVRLCLQNLLGNALKYSSRKPLALIEVGCDKASGAIFVRDNGIGFDMAHVGKLFEPFVRLHREEEFAGSGIGLATVQRIIERHGGSIWAEAVPEEGATFFFTLGTTGRGTT